MCGVIGLIYEKQHAELGLVAAELLKTLEYRGYDSTGAAVQGPGLEVTLAKGVGAPSARVEELRITRMRGQIFCGQVRWATFGAVTDDNSQPHVVRCKTFVYGAHNGNVTNCDPLKAWLGDEGHRVVSDNDGEMVVHTVEHFFAKELAALPEVDRSDAAERRAAMRRAILTAAKKLEGSYAAVIVDPVSRTVWAIKAGSSLYFGLGTDSSAGAFAIASSDLSSILKLTRVVVPLSEGECVEFEAGRYAIFAVHDRAVKTAAGTKRYAAGDVVERSPIRSRLRAKDTALVPPFESFMDQEISQQEQTSRKLITLYLGGSEASRVLAAYLDALAPDALVAIAARLERLRDHYADERIRAGFHELVDGAELRALLASVPDDVKQRGADAPQERLAERLVSSEAGFFADLLAMARDRDDRVAVRLLDVLLEREEVREFAEVVARFVELCTTSIEKGGRIHAVCCGTSFHAAKAAALFFNELANIELIPILPGEFRAQYATALRDDDVIIAVSQSGETKDLIDVLNDVIASGRRIPRVTLVNNVNSTLAQEKSDLVIPLRCGAEVAVPATKSFMAQLVVFYCLALSLGERSAHGDRKQLIAQRRERLRTLPLLLRETFDATESDTEAAAKLLYLEPSVHLLATRLAAVAKEGALKIREVVLNHTEGFEGSEFKHGPNTILGFNTVFGPSHVDALLRGLGRVTSALLADAAARGKGPESLGRLAQAACDSVFSRVTPFSLEGDEHELFRAHVDRAALITELYGDYPLVYVTGPEERDVLLTVSQINTHKIRGASTVVIAEDHPALRGAASKAPADNPSYRSVYITLPRTSDTLSVVFSATVVLQRLALKMSLLKMQYLDRLGVKDHGVHPDVPKNVSKSITVD